MIERRLVTRIASVSGALLKNTAWGVLGEFATRGAKIAQVILMARVLGAEEIGRFNYALALAGLFSVMFDFGVATVAVKELAWAPRGAALRLYGRVKLLSSMAGVVLIGAAALLTPMPLLDRYLAFGLGLYLALNDFSTYVVVAYRARGEFWRETAWRAVFAVMQLAACAAALFLTHQVEWVVFALVVTAAFGMAPLLKEWIRQPPVGGSDIGLAGIAKAILECVPIAGTVLVGTVYMNFDVVVLGRNVAMAEVGWYSVAVKTIFALLIMPLHYLQLATLPAFAAELGSGSSVATRNRWLQGFVLSTTAGGLLSLGTAVVASELLTLLFGAEFAAGGPVLVVFVLIGFLFYLYTPLAQWLLLQRRQKWTFCVQALAMVANIALVLAWVPRWGVWGAVLAAGTTHTIIALGLFLLVWHVGGFTRRESGWWSLFRVTVGITLGICALQLGNGWGIVSKVVAMGLFVVCARREVIALAHHLYARLQPR
jgi:O-antigen/teichoic acid export membrane protein